LAGLQQQLQETGVPSGNLRYNLTWHDWLNLESLIAVSGAIRAAAEARAESRGAHYREDHPDTGDPAQSSFSRVRMAGGQYRIDWKPVQFTRVRPGQTLIPA
jgi:fumarate reductase flavoprotein subunit